MTEREREGGGCIALMEGECGEGGEVLVQKGWGSGCGSFGEWREMEEGRERGRWACADWDGDGSIGDIWRGKREWQWEGGDNGLTGKSG